MSVQVATIHTQLRMNNIKFLSTNVKQAGAFNSIKYININISLICQIPEEAHYWSKQHFVIMKIIKTPISNGQCIYAFRLIVIAEKDVVYEKFPIPLINRLEKHFLTMATILNDQQNQLLGKLKKWVQDFSSCNRTMR